MYYAGQPLWFVIATDIAVLGAVAAGLVLLLRKGSAVWLFALSLGAILVTNVYDLAAGTSRALANDAAMIVTIIIAVIAVLQLTYAWAMKNRGVLK